MTSVRRLSTALMNAMRRSDDSPSPVVLNSSKDLQVSPIAKKSQETIRPIMNSLLDDDSTFYSDEWFDAFSQERTVREFRRSWPQTEQEVEYRYGVRVRGNQFAADGEGSSKNKVMEMVLGEVPEMSPNENAPAHEPAKQFINWEHLPESVVVETDRSNVWNGGSGLFDIEQNETELSRISSLFAPVKSDKRLSLGPKTGRESVLDPRRATTVSVAMKRMKLQPSRFGKLAWALRDMNESYLTPTAVEILSKSSLWATPKEIEDMKARIKAGRELADPDALLWFLATSVPDMAARVSALSFRYEFDDIIGEMIRATSLIKAASLEVCTSELLKRLMRVILLVGNNINECQGGSPVWGISITSLSKLSTIKTVDKSLSVLDCTVAYLDQMAPETFEVSDDCNCAPSAAKYSLAQESKVMQEARKGLEFVGKMKGLEKFYKSALKKLDEMDRELKSAKEAFDKCLDHFCIARGKFDTNEFFGILEEFFESFDKAVVGHEVRQRQLTNPNVRSGLMNPSFMQQRRESSYSFNNAAAPLPRKVSYMRPSIFGRMKPGQD